MSDTVISTHGISKVYNIDRERSSSTLFDVLSGRAPRNRNKKDAFYALDDVTFDLSEGDILGIVGGNGAGKSTLLKILSRVVRPTSGHAELTGRIASLLEVGTGFHPELSGRENVEMSGVILGMTRREVARKFDEIVEFSGVEKFIDVPIKHYSSGMQTRLGFAVAAFLDAEILLVDEVLAVGDADFQKRCLGRMKGVSASGRTIIFISHNLHAVQSLCTRAIWLERGKIRRQGPDVRDIALRYLAGGEFGANSEWNASPDQQDSSAIVSLKRMRLAQEGGATVMAPVASSEHLNLEIEVEVREDDPSLVLGYAISTEDGEILWVSCHTDGPQSEWSNLSVGRVRLQTRIKGGTLNDGRYRIEFICGLAHQRWVVPPGANTIAIHFDVSGGFTSSPYWTTPREGLLAPVSHWRVQTEQLGS
jgi:homopolymeric O-antigen transport system ATP-binding protein